MCQKRMIEYGNIVSFIRFVGRVNLRVQALRDYIFSEQGCLIFVPEGRPSARQFSPLNLALHMHSSYNYRPLRVTIGVWLIKRVSGVPGL